MVFSVDMTLVLYYLVNMRKKNKLVCGVGENDYDGSVGTSGHMIPSYHCWNNMLNRCYSAKCQVIHPTYIGCIVCEEWLLFSNFKKFYDDNYKKGFVLDKDILKIGNKIYSPEYCRFIPVYLNSLLADSGAARGDLPLGVSALKPSIKSSRINITYRAQCNDGYGELIKKAFKTISEAQTWYSITKKRIVKEQVFRAFDNNEILSDVACALLEREW